MGWFGTFCVAAVMGAAGCWQYGIARRSARWGIVAATAVAAVVVKMAGNVTGAFLDGSSVEWWSSIVAGLIVMRLAVGVAKRSNHRRPVPTTPAAPPASSAKGAIVSDDT